MSERVDCDLLKDIRESVRRIRMFTNEMTSDCFLTDLKTQDAVIRNLEIIGEATKSLSQVIREKYPNLPWKGMAGVRDRLIHHYFGVNLDIVWDIVAGELPDLERRIEEILDKEYGGS